MTDLSVDKLMGLLQTWKKHSYLLFNFDQTSHHALVLSNISLSFGTFTNYLVNSGIWEKWYLSLKKSTALTHGFDLYV